MTLFTRYGRRGRYVVRGAACAVLLALVGGTGPGAAAEEVTAATSEPAPAVASPSAQSAGGEVPQVGDVGRLASPPDQRPIEGFVDGRSQEIVAERTQHSKSFRNPDGTTTTRISPYSMHFRGSSGWEDIRNDIIADPQRPGGYRNAANAFAVRFAALPGGVTLEVPE